jgi:NADP-dependent 3-hydroxy acid dehydrogenase YdfG
MDLTNKVIVITGASSGLGASVAEKVAKLGARIALIGRNENALQRQRDALQVAENHAHVFVCDIREQEQVENAVKDIIVAFGTIDILVNNAGVWTTDELEKTRPELRRAALDTNVLGHITVAEEILPILKAKNIGHIVNVISVSGDAESPSGNNAEWKTYGASKWAMAGYTKALRDSLTSTKIKVTGFYPGGFESNIFETAGEVEKHDQPWMMKVSDVADTLIYTLTRPADVVIEKMVVTKMMEN